MLPHIQFQPFHLLVTKQPLYPQPSPEEMVIFCPLLIFLRPNKRMLLYFQRV